MEQTHQPKLYQGRGEGEKSVYLEKKIFFVGVEFWFFSTALGRIFLAAFVILIFDFLLPAFFCQSSTQKLFSSGLKPFLRFLAKIPLIISDAERECDRACE